jgi:hypothetical protein
MSAKTLPHIPINDCPDLQKLRSHRGKPTTLHHLYGPNSLKAMGMAFDAALDALPHEGKREDGIRRELALLIIHLADRGETDPTRLSRLALVTMVGRRFRPEPGCSDLPVQSDHQSTLMSHPRPVGMNAAISPV